MHFNDIEKKTQRLSQKIIRIEASIHDIADEKEKFVEKVQEERIESSKKMDELKERIGSDKSSSDKSIPQLSISSRMSESNRFKDLSRKMVRMSKEF